MWRVGLILFVSGLTACSLAGAPTGKNRDEFQAIKYRLESVYEAAAVEHCRLLGPVAGESYDGMLEAKDLAENQAAQKGATHLLFNNLWSEQLFYKAVGRDELFHAEGEAYLCDQK